MLNNISQSGNLYNDNLNVTHYYTYFMLKSHVKKKTHRYCTYLKNNIKTTVKCLKIISAERIKILIIVGKRIKILIIAGHRFMSDVVLWPRKAKQKQQKTKPTTSKLIINQLNKKTREVVFEDVCIFCANISFWHENVKLLTIENWSFWKRKKVQSVLYYSNPEIVTKILQRSLNVQGELCSFVCHLIHSSIFPIGKMMGSFHFHAPSIGCATNFKWQVFLTWYNRGVLWIHYTMSVTLNAHTKHTVESWIEKYFAVYCDFIYHRLSFSICPANPNTIPYSPCSLLVTEEIHTEG